MKKFFLPLILLVVGAPLVIISCSKSEDPPASTTTTTSSTSSTSTTSSTNSTSSTVPLNGRDSLFIIDNVAYEVLSTTCQLAGGSSGQYFMNGFSATSNKIEVKFHKEPTVAKTFAITNMQTADTSQVQLVVTIAAGSQVYTATSGSLYFTNVNDIKKITFTNITFVKTGLGNKIGTGSFMCM